MYCVSRASLMDRATLRFVRLIDRKIRRGGSQSRMRVTRAVKAFDDRQRNEAAVRLDRCQVVATWGMVHDIQSRQRP